MLNRKTLSVYPSLSLDRLEFNQDGMNNDVIIVDQQLVCRFPKTDWAKEDLAMEIKILQDNLPPLTFTVMQLALLVGAVVRGYL